jgi:hypothetical protein
MTPSSRPGTRSSTDGGVDISGLYLLIFSLAEASHRAARICLMRLFIFDFTGICNRLEALSFAYVIRDYYGHEIVLDWPELDSFRVIGTRRGAIQWHHRFNCIKVRECSDALFESLGSYRNISLRGLTGGPGEALNRACAKLAQDIRLHPRIGRSIRELFGEISQRGQKVVGVHMRRGDFEGAQSSVYDVHGKRHSAVPDWWFQWAMRRMKSRYPDVVFYLSGTGDPASCPWLAREFNCISLQEKSPYLYKGPSHASTVNPIADLFALASCPVILATPASSFSHWAANILGPPSQILMPAAFTEETAPQMVKASHRCLGLPQWTSMSRLAQGTLPVKSDDDLPDLGFANTDWL